MIISFVKRDLIFKADLHMERSAFFAVMDTLIRIDNPSNERPQINLRITDQQCMIKNGAVKVVLAGMHGLITVNFNNGT